MYRPDGHSCGHVGRREPSPGHRSGRDQQRGWQDHRRVRPDGGAPGPGLGGAAVQMRPGLPRPDAPRGRRQHQRPRRARVAAPSVAYTSADGALTPWHPPCTPCTDPLPAPPHAQPLHPAPPPSTTHATPPSAGAGAFGLTRLWRSPSRRRRLSVNLDGWMLGRGEVQACFRRHAAGADIAVVEGVMGLFDGRDGTTDACVQAEPPKHFFHSVPSHLRVPLSPRCSSTHHSERCCTLPGMKWRDTCPALN